ncbi:G patch domain-containing protein 4 [Nilaparvata lugens]|uniref:G patch domain-containing protein 4 n=1 Tax=Nilaparvata lugens TaxID=108931 RepID=UPI00193E24C3|nr:G patch domain-containing protein 4 [Nilaparvata lugens]
MVLYTFRLCYEHDLLTVKSCILTKFSCPLKELCKFSLEANLINQKMDKAETMMLKMGWSQGRGLGKNEDGVKSAIKLNSQMSRQGIGYSEVDTDSWWVRIYDEAAKNVTSYTPSEVEDPKNDETLKPRKRKSSNERNNSNGVQKNKKQKKTKKNKEYSEKTS